MSGRRSARPLLPLALLAALAACRTTPTPQPPPSPRSIAAFADPANAPATRPPSHRPADAFPNAPLHATVLATRQPDGSGADGTPVPWTLTPTAGGWVLDAPGLRRTHYQLDAEGNLLVSREDDPNQNARIEYHPPLVVWPAHGAADGESAMTVYTLDAARVRDRGVVRYRAEPLGRATLDTPLRAFDATLVRVTRSIDLALADVDVVTLAAYAPAQGPVAEDTRRTVRALGLFSDARHTRIQRTHAPTTPPGKVPAAKAR